tara:strand:- start:12127 stop:14040 length:1914 start_codon:yes stop_codon:yes gene_type:complete
MEPKFADYNFNIKFDKNSHVIKVIDRYPKTIGADSIEDNPETLVIFEHEITLPGGERVKEVDVKSITSHHELHQNFGFRYQDPGEVDLSVDEYIPEGSVVAQSPSVSKEGSYQFGIETEVAMMSVPQIIEDGVVASKSFCKKATTLAIETLSVSFGKKRFPLNIYGNDDIYKIFPDIGDVVNEDGILMALRQYDDEMAPIMMSKKALQRIDHKYDERIHVEAGARVVDVKVYQDTRLTGVLRGKSMNTPNGTATQAEKYLNADKRYYQNIINTYQSLWGGRKDSLRISPAFQRLLVEAHAATAKGEKERMIRTYGGVPIDEWRVDITIEYPIEPTVGFKVTGTHGDKGVIVDVWDDEDMPVDAAGNRADLIMDGISTVKRMNVSRLIEQYLNAASRDLSAKVRQMVSQGVSKDDIGNMLKEYYEIVNPKMVPMVCDDKGRVTDDHIYSVVDDGIYLWVPTDNEREPMDIIRDVRDKFPPVLGPVKYRGMSGNIVETHSDILIGSMYIMLLEKTGRNWQGVASSKLSHFGVPAKLTNVDKYATPGRTTPIRFGESEGRLFVSMVGGIPTSELFDRTNNPVVRKEVQEKILRADKPTQLDEVVDRNRYPTGNGRILSLVRHIGECAGWRLVRGGKVGMK